MADTDKPSTALAVQSSAALAVTPSSPEQLFKMAEWIGKSKMYSGINTPEAAFTVMLRGLEMGIPMSVALTEIKSFDGKLSVSARLLESQAMADPEVEYFRLESSDDKQATYVAKRKGEPEIKHTFTMDDAKRAGLDGKDNWKKYPKAMLRAAASRELARIISPRKTIGLRTREEVMEEDGFDLPPPVQPLPQTAGIGSTTEMAQEKARAAAADAEWEPAHDPVTGEVKDAPSGEQPMGKAIRLLGTCRDDAGLVAAREACQAVWPKMADAPADVQTLWKEAKARVEAIKKEGK